MDMSHTVELDACHGMMRHVSRELKTRHCVGDNETIWPYITREHGITIRYGNLLVDPLVPALVTFPNEAYYTWLALKYS
jgi:hypothetical protein